MTPEEQINTAKIEMRLYRLETMVVILLQAVPREAMLKYFQESGSPDSAVAILKFIAQLRQEHGVPDPSAQ